MIGINTVRKSTFLKSDIFWSKKVLFHFSKKKVLFFFSSKLYRKKKST